MTKPRFLLSLRNVAGLAVLLAASVQVHASSVVLTDTQADYSGTQGTNGYNYLYLEGPYGTALTPTSNPQQMQFNAPGQGANWTGPIGSGCCGGEVFPLLTQNAGHGITNPNAESGGSEAYLPYGTAAGTDRQWVNTSYSGPVTINGDYQALNSCCGSNQSVSVWVDGVKVFGDQVGGGTSNGYNPESYSVTANLHPGSVIDWITDPNLGYYGDLTELTGTVTGTTPEPASLTLLGLGMIGLVGYRARRRGAEAV